MVEAIHAQPNANKKPDFASGFILVNAQPLRVLRFLNGCEPLLPEHGCEAPVAHRYPAIRSAQHDEIFPGMPLNMLPRPFEITGSEHVHLFRHELSPFTT